MGYDLHITRHGEQPELEDGGISFEEWLGSVQTDPTLKADRPPDGHSPGGGVIRIKSEPIGIWVSFVPESQGEVKGWFHFSEGGISSKNPDQEIRRKMRQIADRLRARVQGDEGEYYDHDGEIERGPKAGLISRLLGGFGKG